MIKLIKEHLYHESLDEEDPFFFGVSFDENSEIIIRIF